MLAQAFLLLGAFSASDLQVRVLKPYPCVAACQTSPHLTSISRLHNTNLPHCNENAFFTMYFARSQIAEEHMRQKHIASLNDKAYLTAIYQRYAPALFAYLYRHVGSMEDTEDLLLEVFLAALERSGFENLGTNEHEAWLWCVARNKMTDHHRKATRYQHVPLDL